MRSAAATTQPYVSSLAWWQIVLLALLLIPAIVGLADVMSRMAAFARPIDPVFAPQQNRANSLSANDQFVPIHIEIPAIGVSASVEEVGINDAGAMQAPRIFGDIGWYGAGSAPGTSGNAVFDGHVNNALTKAGVFEHLAQLMPGDTIRVLDAAGRSLTFTVQTLKTYPVDAAPSQEIFSRAGPPGLVLITCDGIWNEAQHQFSNRLVVYAILVTSH